MRGAISAANRAYQWHYRFNPRPSCEGRPDSAVLVGILDGSFNPRPSCEGRLGGLGHINALEVFQSTPLMRGATILGLINRHGIHSFNPRPSCEGRR